MGGGGGGGGGVWGNDVNGCKVAVVGGGGKKLKMFAVHCWWRHNCKWVVLAWGSVCESWKWIPALTLHLTPSLPCVTWKHPTKVQSLKALSLFVFFFALALERIFIQIHHTERRCYRTGKYSVFEVHPCIFQPRNLTGWGSKGVKGTSMWVRLQGCKRHHPAPPPPPPTIFLHPTPTSIRTYFLFDLLWSRDFYFIFLCVNFIKLLFSQL